MFEAVTAAAGQIEFQDWKRRYDLASPDEQRRMSEARARAESTAVEEQRYRELLNATKRNSSGFGMGFIWGLIIGS